MKRLLRNRDFLLFLALGLGLFLGQGAQWTEKIVIPALAAVMTLSTMGVSASLFRSPRALLLPALAGIAMNYGVLGGFLMGMNSVLIREGDFWNGLVIMTAVPPAIAVIPFATLLGGNGPFALIGTAACYLAALIITPAVALKFLGSGFADPVKISIIMVELILVPVFLSRILLRAGLAERIEPIKGTITNWCFFAVVYTIVGLNRGILLKQTGALASVAAISLASTFVLGWMIERFGRIFRVDGETITSLVLLGTQKNTGLAAGLALTLFSEKTAVPATVTTIFMIVHVIWLGIQRRWWK